jgi:hypothetical protein
MSEEKSEEDALREAQIQMAPDGPIDIARRFVSALNAGDPLGAATLFDPDGELAVTDLNGVDLSS